MKKQNPGHIVKVLIMFLLVMTFGSVLSLILPSVTLEIAILILCLLFKKGNWRFSKKVLRLFLALSVFSLLSAIITSTAPHYYLSLLFRVLVVCVVCSFFNNDRQEIESYLNTAFGIIACLALVNFFLYTFIPSLFISFSAQSGFQFKTFLFVFNCGEFSTLSFMRNQGVFWEPGVLQVILNIWLIHLVFDDNKIWKIILACALIASTASTTGLILMTAVLFIRFISSGQKKGLLKKIVLLIAFALILLPFVISNVENKVSGDSRGSSAYRTYDLVMGLQVVKNHPIWGIGLDFNKYQNETKDVNLGIYDDVDVLLDRGNTNTIVSAAVFCGLPFAFLFVLGIFKQRIFKRKYLFLFVFIISLCSEPLFIVSFTFMIVLSSVLLPTDNKITNEKSISNYSVL